MKIKKTKVFFLSLITLFFLFIPFLQSFFFSSNTKGVIKIDKTIQADFIQSNQKILLLFFGYVGCEDICTPFLMKLSTLYNSQQFDTIREDVEIIFVNLRPEVEKSQADLFAKFFNHNFQGIYLTKREIFEIDRSFSLYFSQSVYEQTEINHTDHLYLISNLNNTLTLKNIYSTHPLHKKQLINDILSFQ